MKTTFLRSILTTLLLVASVTTWASVEIDGIYYNLDKTAMTASVTSGGYTGSISIPETIVYCSVTYSVTSIEHSAFASCSGLTSVTIPNSVTSIGWSAFLNCTGLTSVTIPNSVTNIKNTAFYGCTSLPVIDNIRYADTYVVEAADKTLSEYNIKEGTRFIGLEAFYGCSGLTSITIPNSVISIGGSAFRECTGLTSVTIPNSVTSIPEYAFSGCSGLTSVTIPNSVTSIGECAFYNCSALTSVTIPNSVTSIGRSAFEDCSGLTSVTIGNSVTSIDDFTFWGCTGLTSVTCYAEKVPNTGGYVFGSVPIESATLHVPSVSVDLYKAADPWKNFGTITDVCATPTITYSDGKIIATSETEGATCHISWSLSAASGSGTDCVAITVPSITITAYATADGYVQSETATFELPINLGEVEDANKDGIIDIADVTAVLNKMFE